MFFLNSSKLLSFCAAFALLLTLISSTAAPAMAQSLQQAIAAHDSAAKGNSDDLATAHKMLKKLSEHDPKNAEIMAYLGSAFAISAREGRNVVSKMRNTNKALRHLDTALELGPDNFTVRMVRASVQRNLPAMFNRGDDAIEDMIVLDRLFRNHDKIPPRMAKAMLPIYDHLQDHAAGRGDWATGQSIAQDRSK